MLLQKDVALMDVLDNVLLLVQVIILQELDQGEHYQGRRELFEAQVQNCEVMSLESEASRKFFNLALQVDLKCISEHFLQSKCQNLQL